MCWTVGNSLWPLKIFKTINFERISEYGGIIKIGWVGFAQFYLDRCIKEFESDEKIDSQLFKRLVLLDSKLGTSASEQLFH